MPSPESFGEWIGRKLLFSDVIESDKRVPCITFTVPAKILLLFGAEQGGNKFGLMAPCIEFWIALVMVRDHLTIPFYILSSCPFFNWRCCSAKVLVMGAIFSTCVSFVIYRCIVLPRKQMHKRKVGNCVASMMTPYLIGFGVIMPICALLPYYSMKYFCIRSKIIKFLAARAPQILFFRCSEGEILIWDSDELFWAPF